MRNEHQTMQKQEAYERLFDEKEQMLSEVARTVLGEACGSAYARNMVRSYCFEEAEYVASMKKMYLAVAQLVGRDRELLSEFSRAAMTAVASIDPDDYETLAGFGVYSANLHDYYGTVSGMIEDILQEDATQSVMVVMDDGTSPTVFG